MTTPIRKLPAIRATVSLAALAVATPAFAQSAAADDNSSGAIREIVVTAQKRAESVQSIPIAVTALDEKAMEAATIKDLRDIAGRVPSLVVDSVGAGPSAAAIAIRGISFEDIEKSFDPAVGVVVDGVFIGTNTGQLLDSFDIERLEVLRGPQGTLFGRNTIGGVINVTRSKPTEEFGVRGQFAYGNFDTRRGRLVVNTGSLGGIIALKAFGYYDETDGYYFNVTKNRRHGKYETLTGGATALITPSDRITAQVTYQHTRERGETVVSALSETTRDVLCLAAGAPGFSPLAECDRWSLPDNGLYTTFSGIETPVRNNTDSLTGNIDIELSDRLTLSSVTGYMKSKESVTQDFDASSVSFFETRRDQKYRQFSQELRLLADFDVVNLLVGGYYFSSNYKLDQFTNMGPPLTGGAPAQLRAYVDHHAKSYAGFADAQIRLSDQFKISLGARYTEDRKRIFNNYGRIGALVGLTMPDFDGKSCVAATGTVEVAPGVDIPVYSPANNCNGAKNFSKFTWRANAEYTIEPGKLIYASFSRGFRSGGFNGRGTTPTSLGPYEPETVDAYEAGLKADWLDRTLRTNFAVYYTKYNNKQEETVQAAADDNPQETIVKNASSADIKGFEAEIIAQLSNTLSFNASFSYTDAQYNRFFNDIVGLTTGSPPDGIADDVSTLTLRRAPKIQWSAGLNYSQEVGSGRIDASTLLRFQSKYVTCIAPNKPIVPGAVTNDNRCFTQDRENLSAQIGYTHLLGEGREVSLSVFGRNLTNYKGLSSTLPVAGLFAFGAGVQPRTYGVELGFRF